MVTQALSFDLAASSFLNHLQIERGLAVNSIAAYRRDLAKFQGFLNGAQLESVTPDHISAFESSLREVNLSVASINRIDSTLRSFFKHLQIEFGLNDPTLEIAPSKSSRRLPKALTIEQILSMIEVSYRQSDPITLRDQAMLELLYSSGARVSELIAINVSDLNEVQSADGEITTLKLRGKGSKERIVPLGSFASKAIDDYCVRIRPGLLAKNPRNNPALFLNSRGGRISRQSAWQMVLDAAKNAGVTEHVSPHVFRHSYATHLLDGGADIRVVQELLGHASVTTTQIYTLITIDKVRESYSMAHPRAK
ncbi:MAG: site-specific tyrosine recombinase XerD [Candidatus Planktophila sp.]|nr:site-specific tyrosine recombinase XerD [Candidatus Planktophila sp.]